MYLLKSSVIYSMSLEKARSNKLLISYIGYPIEPGFFVAGKIGWAGPNGTGYISFPISGPKKSGVIRGNAEKKDGNWEFIRLYVYFENDKRINLLE